MEAAALSPTVDGRKPAAGASRGIYRLLSGIFRSVYPILVILLVWELVSRSSQTNAVFFPSPLKVLAAAGTMLANGVLAQHFAATLVRLLAGVLLAVVIGFVIAAGMAWSHHVEGFFHPIVSLLNPIPGLAWLPFAILWFGLGNSATIFIIALAGIFPMIMSTLGGLKGVRRVLILAAKSMQTRGIDLFLKVLLPAALPNIVLGARLALARGWRALVAGEMIAAASFGLGWLIFDAKQFLQTDVMMVGLMGIGSLGYLLEVIVFKTIEQRTLRRWGMIGADLRNT